MSGNQTGSRIRETIFRVLSEVQRRPVDSYQGALETVVCSSDVSAMIPILEEAFNCDPFRPDELVVGQAGEVGGCPNSVPDVTVGHLSGVVERHIVAGQGRTG